MDQLCKDKEKAALARTHAYLRALYGQVDCEDIEGLLSLDSDRLRVESEARVRNLAAQLKRACPRVAAVSGPDFGKYVASFASAAMFWEVQGRTLAENFCLYLVGSLSPELDYLSDVAQLDGIVSGISTGKISPWPPMAIPKEIAGVLHDGWVNEAIYTRRRLIDRAGLLLDVGNADQCAEPIPSIVVVQGSGTSDMKLYRVDR